ncbi:MAG: glycosyltransferase family 4 protein [Methanobacterium sp.]|jgi:glycosyltransferase involved in cell wall biosynthesis
MDENRLKIAFLTATNPRDKKSRSGTLYYMGQALQKHCGDVYYLGPLDTKMENLTKWFNDISIKLFKKNYSYEHSILLSRSYARIIKHKLREESFDLIFAPVASTEIVFLNTEIPIVYTSDSTFALNSDYYPDYFSKQIVLSKMEGDYIEKSAIRKADLILYPSSWAAHSAIKDYKSDKSKVYIIPFGANIDESPSKKIIMDKKKSGNCKLLFLGVDWKRKGGEIAFETLLELETMGFIAELTVCGCIPPKKCVHDRMTVIPFLDKNDKVQSKELNNLFLKSDFLLLPTRSEAYGVVFCEANAFGLPVITTDTGGVSSVIESGKNGFMLPINAKGIDYAKLIKDIYQDDEKYYGLVLSSRETFEEKLNWDSWAKTVCKLINRIV